MPQPPILHDSVPYLPWHGAGSARLPGVQPLGDAPWLRVDAAYRAQMALRRDLLGQRRDEVRALRAVARDAADELLDDTVGTLAGNSRFDISGDTITGPDGVETRIDRDDPLGTLGAVLQEDLCLLLPSDAGPVLEGAVLCFPAGWTLREKLGRSLLRVHDPVTAYDGAMSARVDRLFTAVAPDRPLWRVNALLYDDPALFQPRREGEPGEPGSATSPYLRSEFQTIRRLPRTRAVVFGIHTYVVRVESLPPEDRAQAMERAARSPAQTQEPRQIP